MSSAGDSKKKIVLKSSDGELFEVEESVAMMSQTIKFMIEDDCAASVQIPLHNVSSDILGKVIEYCRRHAGVDPDYLMLNKDVVDFDAEFLKVDEATLFEIILAANYLDIKSLLELTFKTTAGIIDGMTPEQVRTFFDIENDFTPEEEDAIRKEEAPPFE